MDIRKKLQGLSDEQLYRFVKAVQDFSCEGISCSNCLFTYGESTCIFTVAYDEYIKRGTAE